MIKEFCRQIELVFILAYNFKLHVLKWTVKISVSSKVNWSYILNYFSPRQLRKISENQH